MNKYFAKICFLSLIVTNSFGQINVQYGPKIGVVEAWTHIVNNTDQYNLHPGLDLVGGLFLRAGGKKFELQTEAYYQSVGGKITKGGGAAQIINNYQYISVPLLLGYKVVDGLTLQAGPEYSWALNNGTTYGPDKANDVGVSLGTRIDMLDGFSLLSLNFRYTYGLQNTTNQIDSRRALQDYRNQSFQFAITYNFSDYYNWERKHRKK